MLVGLTVCMYYMVTNIPLLRALFGVTRPLLECRWWGVDPVSAAVFGVPLGFVTVVLVSLLAPNTGTGPAEVLNRIRYPNG